MPPHLSVFGPWSRSRVGVAGVRVRMWSDISSVYFT